LLLSGCETGNDPVTPADTPSQPVADTPSQPAADTPSQPVADAPSQPAADAPSQPAADTPSQPAVPIIHEINVVTVDGEKIHVKVTSKGFIFVGYEGKPVLLEFYGDTCPHCMAAIPIYKNLEAKYGNDILILTIESYGKLNNAGLRDYAASKGMQYRTVAKENSGDIKTLAEELVGPIGGVPYLIILDKDGDIVTTQLADLEESWFEDMILNLL
jgi:thiol-disulfide isomerase/thioredoxin